MMKNIITIDTEEWFHANYEEGLFDNTKENISLVEKQTDRLLEIFEQNDVKATFFVLGYVAEEHPNLLRRIASQGHEIASHGYGHQLVYKQSPEEFREDIKISKRMLEDVVGQEVYGYRAPSWSITEKSLWALDILEEEGYKYNSSIFPTKNYLYGIPYAPRFVHNCDIYGKKDLKLINVSPSTAKVLGGKVNIPFSGGAYFRLLPVSLVKYFTNCINEKEDEVVIFYLHPREIDPSQPRLKLNLRDALIHYYGIKGCEKKLVNVTKSYEFVTMYDYIKEGKSGIVN